MLTPAELPAGIKLIPGVSFTYVADASGLYTMVPQTSILHFDADGTFTKAPSDPDPKNFRKFAAFCSAHPDDIAVIQGRPDPNDPHQLIVYDGDIDILPKSIKVIIAVNDKNIPITAFEREPGEPLTVPKK